MTILEKFKDFEIRKIDFENLDLYTQLLTQCFPKFKVTSNYLNWLYFQNPTGKVIGYDAFHNGVLVAHYACIPTTILGIAKPALLSLNTATLPEFQGRGLFKVLAVNTFELAQNMNFSCVVGVANSKSVNGFLKHLGFELLGNLDLRFGWLKRTAMGTRVYSHEELMWRTSSPLNRLKLRISTNAVATVAVRFRGLLPLRAIVTTDIGFRTQNASRKFGFTLDWKRDKFPIIFLPTKLKPSPLALVFKSLDGTSSSTLTSWSFPDFDVI